MTIRYMTPVMLMGSLLLSQVPHGAIRDVVDTEEKKPHKRDKKGKH